jgi:hypothetical protein
MRRFGPRRITRPDALVAAGRFRAAIRERVEQDDEGFGRPYKASANAR